METLVKINKKSYMDKLYACWIGKNIGGTLGGPYEGSREFLNVTGFVTEPGSPLPNDDLDLQLYWLHLAEEHSPKNISAQLLADYWINGVSPFWNEYGICKTNLMHGLLPPLCGEFRNKTWKNSNGAWIRSEIWASLAPGLSDIAIKYAVMDACVDHGISEGTYAEIFTASLQSAAYFEKNVMKLLEIALQKIPDQCRVAKAVNLVIDEYKNGTPYKKVRELLIEQSADIGFFQSPANLGYVTIGLLYGEGDFKNSVLYAINCGDDTDCTAATVGATMGIMYGTEIIPKDWRKHIGDNILTCAINGQHVYLLPKNCTELTSRVTELMPDMLKANGVLCEFTDEETTIESKISEKYNSLTWEDFLQRSPYSFDLTNHSILDVRVSYDKEPIVKPHDNFKVELNLFNKEGEPCQPNFNVILPNDWSCSNYPKSILVRPNAKKHGDIWDVTINVGENVEAYNRIYVEITRHDSPSSVIVPIVLLG